MAAKTYNSRFEELLHERIEQVRQELMTELEGGQAVLTIDNYRERVGYLRALRDLDDWCSEVATALNKG